MTNRYLNIPGLLSVISIFLFSSASYAYIGPGAGLSAVGAFLALVAAVVVTIFGFIWYPLKRMKRKRQQAAKKKTNDAVDEDQQVGDG